MVYEAHVAKTFFVVLAALGVAISTPLGLMVAGIIPTASTVNGASPLVGWTFIACIWGMSATLLVKALDRKPHLRIDQDGIRYRAYSDDVIPWDQVVSIRITGLYNQRFIHLTLMDGRRFASADAGELGIAATNLSGGLQGVVEAIAHYRPDLFPEGHIPVTASHYIP